MIKKCDCEPFQVCHICADYEQSEKNIEGLILDYLNALPQTFAYKTDTKGNRKKGQWIKSNPREEKGKSDIVCCYKGRYIALEVKKKGGRQSDKQKQFECDVARSGGQYWLVTSLNEVIEKIKNLNKGQR